MGLLRRISCTIIDPGELFRTNSVPSLTKKAGLRRDQVHKFRSAQSRGPHLAENIPPRPERTYPDARESHSRQRVSGCRAQERSSTSPRRGDGSRHAPKHADEIISRKRIMGPSHEGDGSTPPSGTRAAHSSLAQIADQPPQSSRANAKGKERAYDMDVSADRVRCGTDADGGRAINTRLGPPTGAKHEQ